MKLRIEVQARGHGGTSKSELAAIARWDKELFAEDRNIIDAFVWHDGSGHGFNVQAYCDDVFAGYAHVFPRLARADGEPVLMGGLGSVMTAKAFQGIGVASATVTKANQVIVRTLRADLGVLLCKPGLATFYERLGWRRMSTPVHIEQPSGRMPWPYETMVLPGKDSNSVPAELDLCGPPF